MTPEEIFNILVALGTMVITALAAAVTALWRQNNRLGAKLDSLSREIGCLRGQISGMKNCPGGEPCPFRN